MDMQNTLTDIVKMAKTWRNIARGLSRDSAQAWYYEARGLMRAARTVKGWRTQAKMVWLQRRAA